ncbi:MAG: hypothetical protein JST26_19060 [Bacteroidetes bacterium]|nr:hypothetical protein [Bacteroidota bacterium]
MKKTLVNNDQHNKPMDADELFKKLDHLNEGGHEHMDDFEKDALEGFAMLNNPSEAREAYENVLSDISKKTAEQNGSTRSRGIIWFSAAAGLVIIIGLVSLWFNSAKQGTPQNIALNNDATSPAEAPISSENQLRSEAESDSVQTLAPTDALNKNVSGAISAEKQDLILADEKQVVDEEKNMYPFKSVAANEEGKDHVANDNVTRADRLEEQTVAEAKKEEDKVAQVTTKASETAAGTYNWEAEGTKQPVVVTSGTTLSQEVSGGDLAKKKSGKEKTRKYSKDEAANGIASESANPAGQPATNTMGGYYNGPVNNQSNQKTLESKPSYTSANTTTPVSGESNFDMDDSKALANADSIMPGAKPYFDGGDKAVKEYLLKKVNESNKNLVLKGSYRVSATVSSDGTLKVNKLVNTSNTCNACIAALEAALNSMKGWHPASVNGQNRTSAITLFLTF